MGDVHPIVVLCAGLLGIIVAISPLMIYLLLRKEMLWILQRIEKHLAVLHRVAMKADKRLSQK